MSRNCGDQPSEISEDDAEAYRRRAAMFRDREEYDLAIKNYSEVIRLLPNDADAYCERSDCYLRLTHYRQAIADFERVAELDLNEALSRFENTLSFSGWNPFRGAYMGHAMSDPYYWVIDFLQQSLSFEPDSIQAHVQLGEAYEWVSQTPFWDEDDEKQAASHYDEALASPSTDATDYYYAGVAHSRKGDSEKALSCYSAAIELDPDYAPAYADRAMLNIGEGRYESAVADLNNAVMIDPNNPNYSYQRGMARIALGDANGARIDFLSALDLGYSPSTIQNALDMLNPDHAL